MEDISQVTFVHSSANTQFRARNDAIFGGLSDLEEKHEKELPKEDPFSEGSNGKKYPRKPQKVPQHVLHPERWTKYSLEEDGMENLGGDITDAESSNRNIALQFIADLRKRKDQNDKIIETDKMDTSDVEASSSSVGLKRKRDQVQRDESDADNEETGISRNENQTSSTASGFVHKMKTYEVGQKQSKPHVLNKHYHTTSITEKELSLSHLSEVSDSNNTNSPDVELSATVVSKNENIKTKFIGSKKGKKNLRKGLSENDYDEN